MRLFFSIMALIVLVLSCMPCADTNACSGKGEKTISVLHKSTGESDKNDDCSPFCQCSCCAGVPLQLTSYSATLSLPEIHLTHFVFYSASTTRISFAVWQPPKLTC